MTREKNLAKVGRVHHILAEQNRILFCEVCVSVYACLSPRVSMSLCPCIYMSSFVYLFLCICVSACLCVLVCMLICVLSACLRVSVESYVSVYTCLSICLSVWMCSGT